MATRSKKSDKDKPGKEIKGKNVSVAASKTATPNKRGSVSVGQKAGRESGKGVSGARFTGKGRRFNSIKERDAYYKKNPDQAPAYIKKKMASAGDTKKKNNKKK